ncbi:Protein phosphatase [gamma proteobacterium HdN1]|nr:Protein phosphatase [gamma proteobacterium HdN1]
MVDELRWQSSAMSHAGAVRTINEDALLERGQEGLWVVADGMGGHEAGEVASQMVVDSLRSISFSAMDVADAVDCVEDCLLEVHQRIRQYSRDVCNGRVVGSTVVAVVKRGARGVCIWAGDSRLYRLRGFELKQITEDHSQVNEMVARGLLRPDQAKGHALRNVITRAIGAMETLYLDMTLFDLREGDCFLLCSDGLYGAISEECIRMHLLKSNPDVIASALVEDALVQGARDNVTVVVIKAS